VTCHGLSICSLPCEEVLEREFARPLLEYTDARWDKHFDKNLYVAGFWFNPNNQYNDELREKYNFTTFGVLDMMLGEDLETSAHNNLPET
jgi:hypothetical protein